MKHRFEIKAEDYQGGMATLCSEPTLKAAKATMERELDQDWRDVYIWDSLEGDRIDPTYRVTC